MVVVVAAFLWEVAAENMYAIRLRQMAYFYFCYEKENTFRLCREQ